MEKQGVSPFQDVEDSDISSTDAVSISRAVTFGRRMMRRLAGFFIKNIPGFEKAYISREASMVGVRESWRIRGKYYMEADDYLKAHHFPDGVCRTAYPIDIHDVKLDYFEKLKKGQYYEIPYRTLVTNEISNLLVAGRCASGSFAAQASFRIQPTCMSMGEAGRLAGCCTGCLRYFAWLSPGYRSSRRVHGGKPCHSAGGGEKGEGDRHIGSTCFHCTGAGNI